MAKINFVFVVHDHQPVGNFDHVVEDAYARAYLPFIEVMERFPSIPFGLHVSGPLWEWIEEHRPEFWERLGGLVGRGQVEIIGGGFHEPILPVLPERDQIGQVQLMNRRIKEKFGRTPRGAWITERVWEPQLPEPLACCGIEYTFLDDTHFHAAGIPSSELDGLFLTGHAEHCMTLFPISQKMRYAVPFHSPEEALVDLLSHRREDRDTLVCLADDGEKFGIWPGTHDNCYRQKWLERFLRLLEEHEDRIEVMTPSTAVDRVGPVGRTYLPSASYFEMTEWALPAETSRKLTAIRREFDRTGNLERIKPFLKGGHWRNFLSKYEESSRIYHRMLSISRMVDSLSGNDPNRDAATEALYKAQCNCAYWHGVFGGLYLPHLRGALWEWSIRAEMLCRAGGRDRCWSVVDDIDGDGFEECRIGNGMLAVTLSPQRGCIDDIDIAEPAINLIDTLSRRPEAYHSGIASARLEDDGETAGSIHSTLKVKEADLERLLIYDPYPRRAGIDHVLFEQDDIRQFEAGLSRMNITERRDSRLDHLQAALEYGGARNGVLLGLKKRVALDSHGSTLEYDIEIDEMSDFDGGVRYGSEWCINLRDGHSDSSYFEVPGRALEDPHLDSRGELDDVSSLDLICRWLPLRLRFEIDPPCAFWRAPLYTVSASESGIEKVFQGSMLLFHQPAARDAKQKIRIKVLPV